MAGAVSPIANVSVGDSITANLQNHIINAVNSLSTDPLTPQKKSVQRFPVGPQGIILPAVLDSTAPVSYYNPGEVVVITGYLDSQGDRNVASGTDRNFGVTVSTKSDALPVGSAIAVVVRAVEATGSGSVCVSGACLALVTRIASSPTIGDSMAQVTGSLLTGNTFFSIGQGVGDVDLVWEESQTADKHWAYVTLPGSNKKGVPAYNASGVEIPPNSALEAVTGGTAGRLNMRQPSADDLFQVYYSPAYPIPASTPFEALTVEDGTVTTTGAPTIGDEVGTAENSWSMKKDNTGFKVRGLVGDTAYTGVLGGGGTGILVKAVSEPSGGMVNVQASTYNGTVSGPILSVFTIPGVV